MYKFLKPPKREKKVSKYKSVKTEYNGVIYDSKKEAKYAFILDVLKKEGRISDIRRQVKFEWEEQCHANGMMVTFKRKYLADFTYFDLKKNERVIVDVKGCLTAEYKKKKKIVERLFNVEIIEK